MKTAIIGAGFTGLAAAWDLSQAGRRVVVFDLLDRPGGLAAGYKEPGWDWFLEFHYHHIFSKDQAILDFVGQLGLSDLLMFKETQTATLDQNLIAPLDSPVALIKYPHLNLPAKLRTAFTLAVLKFLPSGQKFAGKKLEKFTAKEFLLKTMGQQSWQKLWQPLFKKKFGVYAHQVNAAWFWARIKARTKKLGYFKGGFQNLANQIYEKLKEGGVEFRFETPVANLKQLKEFDQVLFTGSSQALLKLSSNFSQKYTKQLKKLEFIAAQTLVLELDQPFFKDDIYWLNVNDLAWPFLAAVEHTNFVSPSNYGNSHLVYVGQYLQNSERSWQLSAQELHQLYHPYLKQLNSDYQSHLKSIKLFKAKFAQPIARKNHSQLLPPVKTSISGLFWASMQHIYPYDRGTNYAVELGQAAAQIMMKQA